MRVTNPDSGVKDRMKRMESAIGSPAAFLPMRPGAVIGGTGRNRRNFHDRKRSRPMIAANSVDKNARRVMAP